MGFRSLSFVLIVVASATHCVAAASVQNGITGRDAEEKVVLAETERPLYIRQQTLNEMCPRRAGLSDDVDMYACPSASHLNPNSFPCIRYEDLCNGITDCPNGEDEIYAFCMFHKLYEFQQSKVVRELKKLGDGMKEEVQKIRDPQRPVIAHRDSVVCEQS